MAVDTSKSLPSLVVLAGFSLVACSLIVPPKQEEPVAVEDPEPVEEPVGQPQPASQYSDADYEQLVAAYRELEDQHAVAELTLLEKDAQIMELNGRLESQQRMIDETIAEVVRTKAKLRSVESKAEAASQMAEAEIALNQLGELPDGEASGEYDNAADLLEMAADAFDEENYGGAIYLTSQAKTLISLAQLRYRDRQPIQTAAGETAFGLPVPLQVVRKSNVRSGPGTGYRVLVKLEPGVPVTGYSYKGKWVHVKLEDGTDGWIYQPLVGRR